MAGKGLKIRQEKEISETRIGKGWRKGIAGQKPSNLTETRSSVLRGTWRETSWLPLEDRFLFSFSSFFSLASVPDAERRGGNGSERGWSSAVFFF